MQIDETDFNVFIRIKEGLDDGSVRNCMGRIGIFNDWLRLNKAELTKGSIERFFIDLKARGLKNNSLNTYRFMLRHLVSYSKDRGMPSDFFDGFKSFKKTKADIIIFTHEEIQEIIDARLTYGKFHGKSSDFLDDMYRTMTMFLAFTGCRYSEAAELTVKHVEISEGKAIFINTKTNENRTVYFTEPLAGRLELLLVERNPDDRVFRNSSGKQIQRTEYSSDLKRRAKEAGITKRVFPHNFRHSYATHMLEAGVPETQVASLGGWKDIQTLYSTYMHLADKTLQKAAMRHPMVMRSIDPKEIMKLAKDAIENLHLENDNRFKYALTQEGGKLSFTLAL